MAALKAARSDSTTGTAVNVLVPAASSARAAVVVVGGVGTDLASVSRAGVAAATAAVAVGSLVGGRVGVGLARRISGAVLRGVVVAYGVAAAAALLVT